jgi:hypothetical protein
MKKNLSISPDLFSCLWSASIIITDVVSIGKGERYRREGGGGGDK